MDYNNEISRCYNTWDSLGHSNIKTLNIVAETVAFMLHMQKYVKKKNHINPILV